MMEFGVATKEDIHDVLKLHSQYHVETIDEKDKEEGFVTTPFTHELLLELITRENGLFIVKDQDRIIAYAMSASWEFCSKWPMFQYMIGRLHEISYMGERLTVENSYQYGPICIDKEYRGSGVFEKLFRFAMREMACRYPFMITFVNKANPRSVGAHMEKLKLDLLKEFDYNGNHYIELVCQTT